LFPLVAIFTAKIHDELIERSGREFAERFAEHAIHGQMPFFLCILRIRFVSLDSSPQQKISFYVFEETFCCGESQDHIKELVRVYTTTTLFVKSITFLASVKTFTIILEARR
jgi:hypothetical protein